MKPNIDSTSQPRAAGYFVTTRWTLVVAAGRKSSPKAEEALADLCRLYWYPLYAYVRRQNYAREDAEDLTQAFFVKFLEKNYLLGLDSERGRFRAFLLASLKHFLANEWDKAHRQRRGGDALHLSLDWQDGEERYRLEPPDDASPDRLYDRAWAWTLLERVVAQLKSEHSAAGKDELFARLKPFLMGSGEGEAQREAARVLNMDEGAVRVAVHRMRKRYRELLRQEIAQTICDPNQVSDELKSLQEALKGGGR